MASSVREASQQRLAAVTARLSELTAAPSMRVDVELKQAKGLLDSEEQRPDVAVHVMLRERKDQDPLDFDRMEGEWSEVKVLTCDPIFNEDPFPILVRAPARSQVLFTVVDVNRKWRKPRFLGLCIMAVDKIINFPTPFVTTLPLQPSPSDPKPTPVSGTLTIEVWWQTIALNSITNDHFTHPKREPQPFSYLPASRTAAGGVAFADAKPHSIPTKASVLPTVLPPSTLAGQRGGVGRTKTEDGRADEARAMPVGVGRYTVMQNRDKANRWVAPMWPGPQATVSVARQSGPPNSLQGVGMLFERRSWEPYFRITGVKSEGPAALVGVQVNDFLLEVDGHQVASLPAVEVKGRILGTPGSVVQLKYMRPQWHPPPATEEPAQLDEAGAQADQLDGEGAADEGEQDEEEERGAERAPQSYTIHWVGVDPQRLQELQDVELFQALEQRNKGEHTRVPQWLVQDLASVQGHVEWLLKVKVGPDTAPGSRVAFNLNGKRVEGTYGGQRTPADGAFTVFALLAE